MEKKTRHLDIGCGSNPRNPYLCDELHGVDIKLRDNTDYSQITMHEADVVFNPFPFEDNHFSSVSAYDFIEHIPRIIYRDGKSSFPFIDFMNEIYRILESDGKFFAITPIYPLESAFVDPTHVNFITKSSHKYFSEPHLWAKMYGFKGSFKIKKIKKINFHFEVNKPKNILKKILYFIFININPKSKQHILWEFIKS